MDARAGAQLEALERRLEAAGRRPLDRHAHPWLTWLLVMALVTGGIVYLISRSESQTDARSRSISWSGVIRWSSLTGSDDATAVLNDSVRADPLSDSGSDRQSPADADARESAALDAQPAPKPAPKSDSAQSGQGGDPRVSIVVRNRLSPAAGPRTVTAMSRADIMAVQRALERLGYEVGGVDGVVGRRTRAAISAWQTQQGLPTDGQVSEELLRGLVMMTPKDMPTPNERPDQAIGMPSSPIVQSAQPALDRFQPHERAVIERWCAAGRQAADRLGYFRCLAEQARQFPDGTGLPDLRLSDVDLGRRAISAANDRCVVDRPDTDPQWIFKCMAEVMERVTTSADRARRSTTN